METGEDKILKLRQECWDNSLQSFGKAYIFSKRAEKYGRRINSLKIFGIIVPVAVGATATGYGFGSEILKLTIGISVPLIIIQLIISVFAVVHKWDNKLAYSYESVISHNNLSDEFKKLGKLPPDNFNSLQYNYDIIEAKYKARIEQDSKHGIKERELRMGMRNALREFQRKCVGCEKIPLSMESTDCDVCGKFRSKIYNKLHQWKN
jgi:mobilome CxxCx(11)CxxC protein